MRAIRSTPSADTARASSRGATRAERLPSSIIRSHGSVRIGGHPHGPPVFEPCAPRVPRLRSGASMLRAAVLALGLAVSAAGALADGVGVGDSAPAFTLSNFGSGKTALS